MSIGSKKINETLYNEIKVINLSRRTVVIVQFNLSVKFYNITYGSYSKWSFTCAPSFARANVLCKLQLNKKSTTVKNINVATDSSI